MRLVFLFALAPAWAYHVALIPSSVRRASVPAMSATMDRLKAQLANAQAAAAAATSPLQMVNAQEEVDALYDRIERQLMLEMPASFTDELTDGPQVADQPKYADEADLIAKMKRLLGESKFPVETKSFMQIDMHEL